MTGLSVNIQPCCCYSCWVVTQRSCTPTRLLWGNNENATAKKSQFYGGTAGILTGARSVTREPGWSSPCPQWTPCTKENEEEPHGGGTPGAGFTSLFRELQTLCCRKLTRSYGGWFSTYVHVKHTPLLIANWSTKDAPCTRVRATGCSAAFTLISLFIALATTVLPGHKNSSERGKLPEVGLMGLLPLAARPRPRCWTPD